MFHLISNVNFLRYNLSIIPFHYFNIDDYLKHTRIPQIFNEKSNVQAMRVYIAKMPFLCIYI